MKNLIQLFGIKSHVCIAFVAILAIGFSACNDNVEDIDPTSNEPVAMKLSVGMAGAKTSTYAPVYDFKVGDEVGIFIPQSELPCSNMRTWFNAYQWDLEQPVYLNDNLTPLLAYYPFNRDLPSMGNGDRIPIEHGSQTDYMYGRSINLVSRQDPFAFVEMKHALSLVQFCFKRGQLSFEGRIRQIEIVNTGAEIGLYSSGYMSLINEQVVSEYVSSEPAVIRDYQMMEAQMLPYIPSEYQSEMQYPRIMVMPMAPLSDAGQVSIRFHIDNNIYTYPLPEKTAWQSGHKYTYNVTVYSTSIMIQKVFIRDWVEGE